MKKIKLIIALLISINVYSQKDSLEDENVRVQTIFKPMLSEALKIPVNPNPEIPESKKPMFMYSLPDISMAVSPTIYTIKPISLGTMLLPQLKNNYSRLGFGNYFTPVFEIYYNSLRNKNWNNGILLKHHSSNGDKNFNTFSNNSISAYSKYFIGKNSISADVLYHRNVAHIYGFPNSLNPLPAEDTTKLIYNSTELNFAYETLHNDSNDLKVKILSNYNYFSNSKSKSEYNFKLAANFSKLKDGIPYELFTAINSIHYFVKDSGYQRTFFDLNPKATLAGENFYIKAGVKIFYFSDNLDSKLYFLPLAEIAYRIMQNKMTVYTGIGGDLQRNTFRSIATENPFVAIPIFENTVNTFEMYLGLKGHLGSGTSYLFSANIANVNNMLFYVQDSNNFSQLPIYDKGTITLTTYTAEINHHFSEKIRIGLTSKVYEYSMSKLASPFSRPTVESKINATYNIGDKFYLHTDIFYVGERISGISNLSNQNYYAFKLNPFVDLNCGIDYRYNKNVSAFINFNNIASVRYQRWYNYDVYGFNALGGLTLTF